MASIITGLFFALTLGLQPGTYQFKAKANGIDMVDFITLLPSGDFNTLLVVGPDSCRSEGKWVTRGTRFIRTEQRKLCMDVTWKAVKDGDVAYKVTPDGFALMFDGTDWAYYRRVAGVQ